MSGAPLADGLLDSLRRRYPAYHETAYLFVLGGLQHTIELLKEPRHVTGRELAEGCRDFALARFGVLARQVLAYWGIRTTRDLGEIVFALVNAGVLTRQDNDTVTEFEDLWSFDDAFERAYPWRVPEPLGSLTIDEV